MRRREPPVLPVLVFQPGEIPFSGVGRFRNRWIIKIVKHVRQGGQQQAASALEITEDPSRLGGPRQPRPVPVLPVMHLSHEPVPVCDGVDRHDLAKQSPEVLRIPAFGLSATPTEPLAVNMDETALNADRRPQAA